MPVNLTTLFTRLGKLAHASASANTLRGTTSPADVLAIDSAYVAADPNLVDGLYSALASYQGAHGAYLAYLRTLAANTVIQAVAKDAAQPNASLANALTVLIAQMQTASASLNKSTVGASVAAGGSNQGNAAWVLSTKTRLGNSCESLLAEALAATCAADSYSGSVAAGSEAVAVVGTAAVADPLSYLWPGGSGAATTLACVDASVSNAGGAGNYLANGDFETFAVANVPDSWHVRTGAAGTQVLKSTGPIYSGAACIAFVGDAATLTAIDTQPGVDTTNALAPDTQYAVNLWCKVDVAPAAGTLEVALVDGTGTITSDDFGNANSFTVNLVTLGTTFVPKGAAFRTPKLPPATLRLRVRLSVALSVGTKVFLDRLALATMTPIQGPQGASATLFSGNIPLLLNDTWTITTTNDRAGLAREWCQRWFDLRSLGLLFPTSATPTISDTLFS